MFQRLFQICLVVWISPTLLGKTTIATNSDWIASAMKYSVHF